MQTIQAPRGVATPAVERAPRWARWFVWSFLAAFAVCGVAGVEAWPLTGFRLFSHLRHEHQNGWQAYAVHPGGREEWLPLSRFPGGYNGFPLVMKSFSSRSPEERVDLCRAWTVAASGLVGRTVAIRIYAVGRNFEPRLGRRPVNSLKRSLAYTCGSGSTDEGVASGTG